MIDFDGIDMGRSIDEFDQARRQALKSAAAKLFEDGQVQGEYCESQDVPILLAENGDKDASEIGEEILRLSPLFTADMDLETRDRLILEIAGRAFISVEEGIEAVCGDEIDELINDNLGVRL